MVKIVVEDWPSAWGDFSTALIRPLEALTSRDGMTISDIFLNHKIDTFDARANNFNFTDFRVSGTDIFLTNDTISGTMNSIEIEYNFNTAVIISGMDVPLGNFTNDSKVLLKGDDVIRGSDGGDHLWGYDGKDDIDGGKGADTIHGGDGADDINAQKGADIVWGEDGDDLLHGGNGNDVFFGGSGNDAFRFDRTSGGDSNSDLIGYFKVNSDRIELDKDFFKGLGPIGKLDPDKFGIVHKVTGSDTRVLYNVDSGGIFYDQDGSGPKPQKLIVSLVGYEPHLSSDNFFVV